MIDLYTWKTPNGRKVSIMLEECQLDYVAKPVDITAGEQFESGFLSINPNNKIPAIVDRDANDSEPVTLFESGAILLYLAEKTGRFLPTEPLQRHHALQWLMFQVGGVGPIFGQTHHFLRAAPRPVPYAVERFKTETARLYGVLDKQLSANEFISGDSYTIADMATFPWIARHDWHQINLSDYPSVDRWYSALSERPAVARGMQVPC